MSSQPGIVIIKAFHGVALAVMPRRCGGTHCEDDRSGRSVEPLRFEVSRRIKEEFDNGWHYYELHGKPVFKPDDILHRPDPEAPRWHNEHAYRG